MRGHPQYAMAQLPASIEGSIRVSYMWNTIQTDRPVLLDSTMPDGGALFLDMHDGVHPVVFSQKK